MGLRIGSNHGALTALRNLFQTNRREERAFERIASGLRINRGSDDPAGLVISEKLRAQISGSEQALSNAQNASNLLRTADAGLGQIGDLLSKAKSLAVAAGNTGALGADQQRALQNSLDSTLGAIDRIASTTRFAGQPLLNGARDFDVQNASPQLLDVRVSSATLPGGAPQTIDVNVIAAATQAQAAGTIDPVQAGAVSLRLSGEKGNVTLNFAAGATQADVENAINANTDFTGVTAAGGVISSQNVGSDAFVNVEYLSGNLGSVAPGRVGGTDASATIDGQAATANGNVISVSDPNLNASVTLQAGAAGAFSFDVTGGGSTFQIGDGTQAADRFSIGIPDVSSSSLGDVNLGSLASLRTGGANSLINNPSGAASILDTAIDQVSGLRSQLGAAESQVLDVQRDTLDVAIENLTAANSSIRDADLAEEITNSLRERLLRESGLKVLRASNVNQGSVLRLLGQ